MNSQLEIENQNYLCFLEQYGITHTHSYFSYPAYTLSAHLPKQGFKFHISSILPQANQVAQIVVPHLIRHQIPFKIIKDLYVLSDLNRGMLGYSQIGKFITIYPMNEQELVFLAEQLLVLTKGLHGPNIPSDYQIGDVLYYRYGTFSTNESNIQTPSGDPIQDTRLRVNAVPDWADDPFHERRVSTSHVLPEELHIYQIAKRSGKGSVLFALDFSHLPPTLCVIKEAYQHGNTEMTGVDAVDRMKWEFTLLNKLSQLDSTFARPIELFPIGKNLYMKLLYYGESLLDHIRKGTRFTFRETIEIMLTLCLTVHTAHSQNLILRDLSFDNILYQEKKITVIDVEYAYRSDGPPLHPIGTPGFSYKPQMNDRKAPLHPTVSHDLYSLGSIWYHLLYPEEYLQYLESFSLDKEEQKDPWEKNKLDQSPEPIKRIIQKCIELGYNSSMELWQDITTLKEEYNDSISNELRFDYP